jgi:hypothetical protein
VSVGYGNGDLLDEMGGLHVFHGLTFLPGLKVTSCHEVHGKEMVSVFCTDLMNGNDTRVAQIGRGLSFGLKALQFTIVSEPAATYHLDGHGSIQIFLVGLIDHAHASAGDLLNQGEVSDLS